MGKNFQSALSKDPRESLRILLKTLVREGGGTLL